MKFVEDGYIADHDEDFPEFLRRNPDNTLKCPTPTTTAPTSGSPTSPTPAMPGDVPACAASTSTGNTSGGVTDTAPGTLPDFQHFKTTDPLTLVRREADILWHSWTPTKEEPKRPQKRTLINRVKARLKKEGRL